MLLPGSYLLLNDYLSYKSSDDRNKFPVLEFIAHPDNIGNIVFLEAINDILPGIDNLSTFSFIEQSRRQEISQDRIIVLALANFISSHWVARPGLIDALSRHRVVLFSVGIQERNPELSADAKAVLDMAAQSGTLIGARGTATADFLRAKGYRATSIGCPSVLAAKEDVLYRARGPITRICTSNTHSGQVRLLAKAMNAFSLQRACGAIMQTESGIIADLHGLSPKMLDALADECANTQHAALLRNRLFDYGYYSPDGVQWHELRAWYLRHARFFYRITDWRAYMAGFDAIVGARFHGNIVGLQAGCLPIFLPPDDRVLEMVDHHHLPRMSLPQLQVVQDGGDFPQACRDLSAHLDRRGEQLAALRRFIKQTLPVSRFHFKKWGI